MQLNLQQFANVNLSLLRKLILLPFLFLLFLSSGKVAAQSITFTGATTDFTGQGITALAAGSGAVTYYASSDGTFMYFGAFRTGGSNWGSTDHFTVYVDADPRSNATGAGNGSTVGLAWDNQTPNMPFRADYRIAARTDGATGSGSGSSFYSTNNTTTNTASWSTGGANARGYTQYVSNASNGGIEIRVPLSDFGNPASTYVSMYASFNGGGGGFFGPATGTFSGNTLNGYLRNLGVYKNNNITGGTATTPITDATSVATPGDFGDITLSGATTSTLTGNVSYSGALTMGSGTTNATRIGLSTFALYAGGRGVGGTAGQLIVNGASGAPFTSSSGGSFNFLGAGQISGANNQALLTIFPSSSTVTIGGAVDFGNVGGTTTSGLAGTLQINAGGSVNTNPPSYISGSTLVYNTGGTYTGGSEWTTNSATAKGVPSAVTIQNSTFVNFGASTAYRQANGLVTIGSGSSLTLSSASGGDLRIAGGLTNNNTATGVGINTNGRALQTMASTTTTYTKAGTDNLDFLIIGNTGQLTLASGTNLSLTNTNASGCLQWNSTGAIFLGGTNTISIVAGGTVGGSSAGSLGGSSPTTSLLNLLGTCNWSPGGVITVSTQVGMRLNGGLTNTTATRLNAGYVQINQGGFVSSNPIVYASSSTLVYNHSSGSYGIGANEWPAASSPTNVTVNALGGGIDFGGNNQGARTVAGTLTLNGSINLNGTGTPSLTVNGATALTGGLVANSTATINGSGAFTLGSGANMTTANAGGINGTITTSGTKTFNTNNIFAFNGSVSQATGALLPATVAQLIVANTAGGTNGVTISNNTLSISGQTTLTSGALILPTGVSNLVTFTGNISTPTSGGTITGSTTSNIATSGTTAGTANTLSFTSGGASLNNWTHGSNNFGSSASSGLASVVTINGTFSLLTTGVPDFYTTSTGGLVIASGATYTDNGANNDRILGAGSFNLQSGATLLTGNTAGLNATSTGSGAIQSSGTRTFSGGANYTFNNGVASAQTIGDALDGTAGAGKTGVLTGIINIQNNTSPGVTLNAGTTITVNTPGTFNIGVSGTSSAILTAPALSVINGTGTINMFGNGATNGSTLVTAHATGVNGTFATSTTNLTNGGNNNTNFTFNGAAAQVTGSLLPATVNNLNFSNTFSGSVASPSVTLTSSVTTAGTLTFAGGTAPAGLVGIGAGNTLTVNGILTNTNANKLVGTSTSNFIIGGTGAVPATGIFAASGGGTLNNFTLNRTGQVVVAGAPVTVGGTFSLSNGALSLGSNTLTLNGAITLGSGTLTTASTPLSIGGSGAISGNLTATTGNLSFSGITMNRSATTLNLGSSATVSNPTGLTLTAGYINLAANNLTSTGVNGLGAGSSTSHVIATSTGQAFNTIPTSAFVAQTWPIGDGTNYTPTTLTFSANAVTGTVGARVTANVHPSYNNSGAQTNYLNRFWSFTTTGLTTYTYTSALNYVSGDIVGTEGAIKLNRWSGTAWTEDATSTAASNVLTSTTGVTNASFPLSGDYTGRKEISAIDYVWNGSASNDWATAANWTPNGIPTALDNVSINVTGSNTNCTINSGTKTINNFTLNGTGAFAMVTGTSININGTVTYDGTSGATASLDCASTFSYSASTSQTVAALNYGNLNLTGGNRILAAAGTIGICGAYTPGAGTITTTGSTVNFNASGVQTIPASNYNNLTSSSSGARTLANSGTITIAGTFTAGTNTFTNTGSTVALTSTTGFNLSLPTVASGNSFNVLTINGAGGVFNMPYSASTQNLATTLNVTAGTLVLNPSTSTLANTVAVGTININGGTLDDQANIAGLSTVLQVSSAWNHTSGTVTNSSTNGIDRIRFTGGGATTFSGLTSGFSYFGVQVSNNTTLTLSNTLTVNGLSSASVTVDAGSTLNAGTNVISSVLASGTAGGYVINGTFKTANTVGFSGSATTALNTVTNTPTVTLGAASTIEYTSASTAAITGRSDYANLTVSGAGTFSFGATTAVALDYTQSAGTVRLTTTATVNSLNVAGNFVMSGSSTFNVLANTNATTPTTLTVTGTTTTSGSSSINLESVNNANISGTAIFQTTDFTTSSASTSLVNFGSSTVAGNEFRISGNFSKSGTGTFNTGSSTSANGFIFNKAGAQTFSYAGTNSQYTQYIVNSGSTLQLLTGLTLMNATNPTCTFTVNNGGTLDMGSNVISAINTTDPIFTLASGATLKTANATGVQGSFSGFGSSKLVLSSGANYEFQGAATGAFTTTPTALTVNNFVVNKTSGDLLLNQSFTVNGNLTMTSGNLDLNGSNNITLGASAALQNETTAKTIKNSGLPTATNGWIGVVSRTLSSNPGNVANLGMNIAVASAMGNTTIKRFPKTVSAIPNALNSVSRVYSIQPTTASSGSTITFNYFDGELNSNTEASPSLTLYNSIGTNETTAASYNYAGVSATDASANTVTLNTANLTTTNTFWTALNTDKFFTAQAGDWNDTATWTTGVVPPASSAPNVLHAVTVNATVAAVPASVTVTTGGLLTFGSAGALTVGTTFTNGGSGVIMTSGGTLTMNSGATLANGTNTFIGGSGTIVFAGTGAISGTLGFNNLTLNGATTIPATVTVNGNLTFNATSASVSNAPSYGASSNLIYAANVSRGGEWSTTSPGAGYPVNVIVQNGATLTANQSFDVGCSGNLQLGSTGSAGSLTMASTGKIIVAGNVTVGSNSGTSTLTLSSTTGGDIKVGGNWTRTANGTFEPNGRAVFFTGSATNVINSTGGASFDYLVSEKSAGAMQLGSNLTVNAPNGGNALSLKSVASFALNGYNLNLTNATSSNVQADGGTVNFTGTGIINFANSTKTFTQINSGSFSFGSSVALTTSTGVNFGSGLSTINGTFQIDGGGFVQTNAPIYGSTSTLIYNSNYGRNLEWSATSGAGYPNNVSIIGGFSLNLAANGFADRALAGDLTLGVIGGAAGSLSMGATSNRLTVGGNIIVGGNTSGTSTLTLSSAVGGDIYVNGNWTRNANGSFVTNSRAVFFQGTGTSTITTITTASFDYLFINKTSAGKVVLANDMTVNNSLTFSSGNTGVIQTDIFKVIVPTTATVTRTGSGHINGNLRRFVPTGTVTALNLPIGDATNYSPAAINFAGTVSGTGYLDASVSIPGAAPSVDSGLSQTKYVDRKWTITNTGVGGFTSFSPTFTFVAGDIQGSATTSLFTIRNLNSSTWSNTTLGSALSTSTSASGVTSFGDYVIGESAGIFVTTQPAAANVCNGSDSSFVAASTSLPTPTVKWQRSTDGGTSWADVTAGLDSGTIYSNFTTDTLNLTGTTTGLNGYKYRVVYTNINGNSTNSNEVALTVNGASVGGSVTGDQTVCPNSQPTSLTLSSNVGSVIKWQSASNTAFTGATDIVSTSLALTGATIGNVAATTYFRAVVQNGACLAENSTYATVTVNGVTTWTSTGWDNGAPDSTIPAKISYAYSEATDLSACSLIIDNGALVSVPSNFDFNISGAVDVQSGSLTVQNNANLIQSGVTNNNSGEITSKRINSSMRRLDYTYWSSPTAKSTYSLKNFSPMTMSLTSLPQGGASRFYELSESGNVFVAVDPLATYFDSSNIAKGFSIRAPNNFPTNGSTATFNADFVGVPNNGTLTIPVTFSGGSKGSNLIGNPYPSAIDALSFLQYTPDAGATYPNAGTMYFWTHTTQTAGSANYASYNLSGGTASSLGGSAPNGTVQVGQGFLLKKSASSTVVFANSMRVGNNSGQFFRTATTEKHRIWLNLATETTPVNQMMIGYIEGTTLGFDDSYDGKLLNSGSSISSKISDENYVIQARPTPFENTDAVALNFKADTAGSYTLSIDHVDGLFLGEQNVYLRDNMLNVTHDIKASAYTFTSEQGTFGDRFDVVYNNSTLNISTPTFDANSVIVYKNDNNVLNINASKVVMKNIKIYDVRGRMIYEQSNINSTTAVLSNLKAEQGVLLVKVTSEDNKVVTKKVVY